MQIFYELNKNPKLSLALGFFDGVHLGHEAVIKSAVDFAKKHNSKSAVITFKDHPCCYLWNLVPQYILEQKEREKYIASLGVDYLYVLEFSDISGLTADDYLKDVLINNFMPISISTGWNHYFGYKKTGNAKLLKTESKKYGYEYFELSPQKLGDEIISSTKIRTLLASGSIEKANKMLGYEFFVEGRIVKGNQIGRTIGYKTANMNYPKSIINLPYGVYNVNTNFGEGIANFGIRPTINGDKPVLEVHIVDFDEDIYGKNLKVSFKKMIRKERKFKSLEELKKQINIDLKSI